MAAACDGKHHHTSWCSVGPEYPEEFWAKTASLIANFAEEKGVALVARPIEEDAQDESVPMTQQRRAESGIQPRGRRYPELVE